MLSPVARMQALHAKEEQGHRMRIEFFCLVLVPPFSTLLMQYAPNGSCDRGQNVMGCVMSQCRALRLPTVRLQPSASWQSDCSLRLDQCFIFPLKSRSAILKTVNKTLCHWEVFQKWCFNGVVKVKRVGMWHVWFLNSVQVYISTQQLLQQLLMLNKLLITAYEIV